MSSEMVSRLRGLGGLGLLVALALLLLFGPGSPSDDGDPDGSGGASSAEAGFERPGGTVEADVVRVVDGDTIEVELEGRTEDVRYIGVDTPETVKPGEPVECFGPEASEFNHDAVEGERVRLEFDRELRDDYGRLLAYVSVDGDLVNAELIEGGYARTLEIEPNTSRAAELAELEAEAGREGAGLWSAC